MHRLVASAFIDNPDNKPQVNHINGVKSDNRACNLEWVTNRENQIHANLTGLRHTNVGESSHRFKGVIAVYDKNGLQVDTLYGNADMASKGFDYRLVSACVNGKRKSHRGFTFTRIRITEGVSDL